MNDIVSSTAKSAVGCHVKGMCVSVLLYADDILLLAPSVNALQKLVYLCESELRLLDMAITACKVLRTTCSVDGKHCFLDPCPPKTIQPIDTKFGRINYVVEFYKSAKFGLDRA